MAESSVFQTKLFAGLDEEVEKKINKWILYEHHRGNDVFVSDMKITTVLMEMGGDFVGPQRVNTIIVLYKVKDPVEESVDRTLIGLFTEGNSEPVVETPKPFIEERAARR